MRADGERVPGRADDHAHRRARRRRCSPATCATSPTAARRGASCAPRARASSRPPTRRAGGSSATSTTAPSSGWSALALDLRLARAALDDDADAARELLDEAIDDLAAATAELRELARGIHPAVADRGRPRARRCAALVRAQRRCRRDSSPCRPSGCPAAGRGRRLLRRRRGADQRRPPRRGATRAEVDVARRRRRAASSRSRDDGRGGADPAAGTGLRGLADRSPRSTARLDVDSPPGGGHDRARGDPMRVVIAEDSVLLREGGRALLEDAGHRGRRPGRRRRGPAAQGARAQARRRDRRHPHAADPRRRGPAGRARRSAPSCPDAACSCSRSTSRSTTSTQLLGRRRRGRRLPAQGPRRRRRRASSTRSPRGRRAARCSTPRSSRSMLGRRARGRPARRRSPTREREVLGLMAEGRTNRAIAERLVRLRARGRAPRHRDLRQARPARDGHDHRRVLAVLAYLRER